MTPFKAGFVAILGRPNVGKSTLLNALLKFKLSIVSPKPQTTLHKILGILNDENYQICFLDTPGLIETPRDRLQQTLKRAARQAAREDADIAVVVVDPRLPTAELLADLAHLSMPETPLLLVVNKTDAAKPEDVEKTLKLCSDALKPAAIFRVSALKGEGVASLLEDILKRLPESDAFYDKGQVSDRWERFFAAEIIREQVFSLYAEEVPHATAVVIDQFKEGKGAPDQVYATLYIERDSQKGIILGAKGRVLRELTDKSRDAMEKFLSRQVDLEIWVKVRQNWRKDPRSLAEFGY